MTPSTPTPAPAPVSDFSRTPTAQADAPDAGVRLKSDTGPLSRILETSPFPILLVCLVGIRVGLKRPSEGGLGKLDALFWLGLAAGLGLFAIRFAGGNASWWTGHLTVVPLG